MRYRGRGGLMRGGRGECRGRGGSMSGGRGDFRGRVCHGDLRDRGSAMRGGRGDHLGIRIRPGDSDRDIYNRDERSRPIRNDRRD